MSHGGWTISTPLRAIDSTKRLADADVGPDRVSMIRWRAPRMTIHLMMATPMPPKPPATTYVASSEKQHRGFTLGSTQRKVSNWYVSGL